MIFGHSATSVATHRRRALANTSALTEYEADLTSKDRAKQKEAIKRFLANKVREDWTWDWPRNDSDADEAPPNTRNDIDSHVYRQWKERDEWVSNASESADETSMPPLREGGAFEKPETRGSPFRFDSPDGVGESIRRSENDRKRRRKKRLAEEMVWNNGLRCFVQRRDAWTGARRVPRPLVGSVRIVPVRRPSTSLSGEDGSSTAMEDDDDDENWDLDTEIPIPDPLLPPTNAIRASITPATYNTIYDKVVVQSLTPSCPINLRDVTRSCVQGWKRDGEWPPKGTVVATLKKKGRRMSVASLFGLDKGDREKVPRDEEKDGEKNGGSLRRSLQRVLGIGKDHHGAQYLVGTGTDHTGKAKDSEEIAAVTVL